MGTRFLPKPDLDNLIKQEGLTALHKAIIGKKEAVISHLLRKGASPHVKDKVRIHLSTAFLSC